MSHGQNPSFSFLPPFLSPRIMCQQPCSNSWIQAQVILVSPIPRQDDLPSSYSSTSSNLQLQGNFIEGCLPVSSSSDTCSMKWIQRTKSTLYITFHLWPMHFIVSSGNRLLLFLALYNFTPWEFLVRWDQAGGRNLDQYKLSHHLRGKFDILSCLIWCCTNFIMTEILQGSWPGNSEKICI